MPIIRDRSWRAVTRCSRQVGPNIVGLEATGACEEMSEQWEMATTDHDQHAILRVGGETGDVDEHHHVALIPAQHNLRPNVGAALAHLGQIHVDLMTFSHRSWRIRAQQLFSDTLLPNPLMFRCLVLLTLLRHAVKERDVPVLTVLLGKSDRPLPADRAVKVMPIDAIDALVSGHPGQAESQLMQLVGREHEVASAKGLVLHIPLVLLVGREF